MNTKQLMDKILTMTVDQIVEMVLDAVKEALPKDKASIATEMVGKCLVKIGKPAKTGDGSAEKPKRTASDETRQKQREAWARRRAEKQASLIPPTDQ